MTLTSGHVTALRGLLAAGDASPAPFPADTGDDDDLAAIGALLTTAFLAAARARFAGGWSRPGVIRFVSRMRIQYGTGFDEYDPAIEEALLTATLGNEPLPGGIDPAANTATQIALLKALTSNLDEQGLDQLLDDARIQADRWLGKGACVVTTPATGNPVAVLRALIAEDWDTFHQLNAAQDTEQSRAFAVLLAVTFVKAVTGRFGGHPRSEDTIDFVSDARVRLAGPDAIVPENAERVIRAALGESNLIRNMDMRAFGAAQSSVLFALAHENDTSAALVGRALAEAAEEVPAHLACRDHK